MNRLSLVVGILALVLIVNQFVALREYRRALDAKESNLPKKPVDAKKVLT